jgi:glycosyltransferase involved in cell wall biosynthesis
LNLETPNSKFYFSFSVFSSSTVKSQKLPPQNNRTMDSTMTVTSNMPSTTNNSSNSKLQARPLHVVFIHLDLGIGGAEQLVLQLATASAALGHKIDLVTTRCEPNHCFAAVKPGGALHHTLHVWGQWIPANIAGYGQAACSTVRLLYLAYRVARKKSPDVIVLDVLPTPLAFLTSTNAALLFYCHFPDKLLTRTQNPSKLSRLYRSLMDAVEERSMQSADVCVVNSLFTRRTVLTTFTKLRTAWPELPVVYPALDTSSLDSAISNVANDKTAKGQKVVFVSLNRFERKKNLGLLLEAAAWLRQNHPKLPAPTIIIAGGYDVKNVENVQYRAELGQLADELQVPTEFVHSISDAKRAELLQTATAVIYTPANEHFGIVPLEAMYAGTPVVAVNSGGPTETVRDGTTGFLCQPSAAGFGKALSTLMQNPAQTVRMGQAARKHVQDTFGEDRLQQEWKQVLEDALVRGRARMAARGNYHLARTIIYCLEAILTLLVCLLLTWLLRQLGLVEPSESIWGTVRRAVVRGDEL